MVSLAFFVGLGVWIFEGRRVGLKSESLVNLALIAVGAGWIGARGLFILIQWPRFTIGDFQWWSLWEGGVVFLGGFYYAFLGMILWGVSMGSQESIMRSSIAVMTSVEIRGRAYGVLNTAYGVSWFAGSVLMGYLYGISILYLVIFSVVIQLVSVPFFISILRIKD